MRWAVAGETIVLQLVGKIGNLVHHEDELVSLKVTVWLFTLVR